MGKEKNKSIWWKQRLGSFPIFASVQIIEGFLGSRHEYQSIHGTHDIKVAILICVGSEHLWNHTQQMLQIKLTHNCPPPQKNPSTWDFLTTHRIEQPYTRDRTVQTGLYILMPECFPGKKSGAYTNYCIQPFRYLLGTQDSNRGCMVLMQLGSPITHIWMH